MAQNVAQDVAEGVLGAAKNGSVKVFIVTCVVHRHRGAGRGAGFAFGGPGGARPHRHATTTAAAVFAQLAVC